MTPGYILLWWVGISSLFLVIRSLKSGISEDRVGVLVGAGGLIVMGAIAPLSLDLAGYAGTLYWAFFVLLPGILQRRIVKNASELELRKARRQARFLSWIQPWGGGSRLYKTLSGIERAHELGMAPPFSDLDPLTASAAVNVLGYQGRWEELLSRVPGLIARGRIELAPFLLRALGETGQIEALNEAYRLYFSHGPLAGTTTEAAARLIVLAFHGDSEGLLPLLHGPLATFPEDAKEFWRATAYWARGDTARSTPVFESLKIHGTSLRTRRGAEQRLSSPPKVIMAPQNSVRTVEDLPKWTKAPAPAKGRATLALIVINVVVFILVELTGGSTNQANLLRWGMLVPEAVAYGQYWRLIAAAFLHFGVLHLFMNMLALNFVGHFVEVMTGSARFLALYLLYAVGSMGVVTVLSLEGILGPQVLVGASGAVTGLIGLSASLFLKSWVRDRNPRSLERLRDVFIAVLIQVAFDLSTKQVSMTAHLAGTVIGFLTGFLPVEKPEKVSAS